MSAAQDPRIGTTHNRALCCECGAVRLVKAKANLRNGEPGEGFTARRLELLREGQPVSSFWHSARPGERFYGELKCAACAKIVRHAVLRDVCNPEYRDYAEELEASEREAPEVVECEAETALAAEVGRLEAFGIQVMFRSFGPHKQPTTVEVQQWTDDRSWTFTLNDRIPAQILHESLSYVWARISDASKCETLRWRRTELARSAEFTYRDTWFDEYAGESLESIDRTVAKWGQS